MRPGLDGTGRSATAPTHGRTPPRLGPRRQAGRRCWRRRRAGSCPAPPRRTRRSPPSRCPRPVNARGGAGAYLILRQSAQLIRSTRCSPVTRTPARSFERPGGRDPEVAGEVLVGVLGQDEPGGAEDRPWIFVRRGEDVDGLVAGAVGDDEPLVLGENDAGPFCGGAAVGGVPGGSCDSGGDVPGRLPSAAGERGGGLGGERGRREDARGEQYVFQPAGH